MTEFKIYHVINPDFTARENQSHKFVGTVQAFSADDAFMKSQNMFHDWNPEKPCRSTSVGDVIECNGVFKIVNSYGYSEVDGKDITGSDFDIDKPLLKVESDEI